MKSNKIQILFADGWPTRVWILAFLAVGFFWFFRSISLTTETFRSPLTLILLSVAFLAVAGISYLVSLVAGSCFLAPIFRSRERLNGAPFQEGDTVEVLCKPHRGQKGRVASPGDPQYGIIIEFDNSNNQKEVLPLTAIRLIKRGAQSIADGNTREAAR